MKKFHELFAQPSYKSSISVVYYTLLPITLKIVMHSITPSPVGCWLKIYNAFQSYLNFVVLEGGEDALVTKDWHRISLFYLKLGPNIHWTSNYETCTQYTQD